MHTQSSLFSVPLIASCLGLAACGGDDNVVTPEAGGPFKSLAPAANAPGAFNQPRAGVPLDDGTVAFIALDTAQSEGDEAELGARWAVFLQPPAPANGEPLAPSLLYAGDSLVSPLDIEASVDGRTLFIADYAGGSDGGGAIMNLPVSGGEPSFSADGWSPRSVTLGSNGKLYFSGVDPELGEPGVFALSGDAVETVFAGAPLIDPSGIAVFDDGRVLVADTRAFDGLPAMTDGSASEAGVTLLADGRAQPFANGFATGFPAGIALTLDESTLIISGQGPDRSDTVYLVDVKAPSSTPTALTDVFSQYQDSSAGLKRAHGQNTFIWASLSFNDGTVFRIEG